MLQIAQSLLRSFAFVKEDKNTHGYRASISLRHSRGSWIKLGRREHRVTKLTIFVPRPAKN